MLLVTWLILGLLAAGPQPAGSEIRRDAVTAAPDVAGRLAALDACDPLHHARQDLPQWLALLDDLPAAAPQPLRLAVLRGAMVAAWEDQQPGKVRILYSAAASLAPKGSRDAVIVHTLGALALANEKVDANVDAALAKARAAMPEGDKAALALIEQAAGRIAWARDNFPETLDRVRRAYEAAQAGWPADHPRRLALQLQYIEYLAYADLVRASKLLDDAEQSAAQLPGDHPLRLNLLTALAMRAQTRGWRDDGAALIQQALDFGARVLGPTDPRLFNVLQWAAINSGDMALGEQLTRQAFAVANANPGLVGDGDLAMNHELLANYILMQGRTGEAIAEIRKALARLATVDRGDLRWAHIELRLARALSAQGANAEAAALAEKAMPAIAAKLPTNHVMRSQAEQITAIALSDAGRATEAYRRFAPIAEVQAETVLDIVASEQSVDVKNSRGMPVFPDAAIVAFAAGAQEDGLRYAELASISGFATSTAYLRYPAAAGSEPMKAMFERIRRAREGERKARQAAQTAQDKATDPNAVATLSEAKREVVRLEAELERRFPDYRNALKPQPVPLKSLQAQLGPADAIVLPLVRFDRVLTVTVTREALTWQVVRTMPGSFQTDIDRLRATLDRSVADDRDRFDSRLAHRLYKTVFTPRIERALKGKSHLIFPTNGPFQALPPAVLVSRLAGPDGHPAYLSDRFAVSFWSSFEPWRDSAVVSANGSFAGIGDPALGPAQSVAATTKLLRSGRLDIRNLRAMPSLTSAGRELVRMRSAFAGETMLLTGAEATEGAVRASALGRYRVVAFATHGLVGGEAAGLQESALVLTPPAVTKTDDDGLLTASEIANLSFDADWIILSGCNTANGGVFTGLARAFRIAGAKSLLLSHWPVRDDAAARITVRTVQLAATGMGRAEALRRAQLELKADRKLAGATGPAVWAPFVLVAH